MTCDICKGAQMHYADCPAAVGGVAVYSSNKLLPGQKWSAVDLAKAYIMREDEDFTFIDSEHIRTLAAFVIAHVD